MTIEERQLVWRLVTYPPGSNLPVGYQLSIDEFLQQFPRAVERSKLVLTLLEEACRSMSADDVTCALIVGFKLGFAEEHFGLLVSLLEQDWHRSHEDIVSALDDLITPKAVEILYRSTQKIPDYLAFDDTRALASKAIWALGNIGNKEAIGKLTLLSQSEDSVLREDALEQLNRLKRSKGNRLD